MEVNYYQDAALPENRVDVYYREQDTEITGLMEYLEAERVIVGRKDRSVKRIFLREVYYRYYSQPILITKRYSI